MVYMIIIWALFDRLKIMRHNGCFSMCHPVIFGLYVQFWKAVWFPAPGLLACINVLRYGRIQRQTLTHSHIYNLLEAVLASISTFLPLLHSEITLHLSPSGLALLSVSLHTKQSKILEMIWPDQRVRIIHSASVRLFCIRDSQHDWIFHLHTRLLSNVTHTSLKQHCHRLLASSILPVRHFSFLSRAGVWEKEKKNKAGNILLVISCQQGRK